MQILEDYDGKALPKLETDRLILRQRTVEDVPAMFDYARLEEVTYPAGFPPIASLEDEYDYFENHYYQNLKKANLPSGYGIAVKGSDRIIGSCDFNHRHEDDVFEIGYLLHPDYWGQGYMTEAVAALIEVGFTILNLHKLEIRCYDHNKASQRVAEKLGFTLEATIRNRKDGQGNRCSELAYGLLKSEWEKQ
ncbi:GNAT family N-acetyltransferase [Streptococcus saliviloxodontae]|uniref:RimJ/RimL family protein N-acetyltransferase n=1 Tax=Streptococcus saliviloxodontae TaxID=1349416 RepID=A0ABS2PNM4_9STRE|nr:GNAT family N-acetyltransferase [Streptococcus saliviloxodontae]MBM7637035.1 RimJ/RimL family protein N-acetyltransferase [Streptococcus saliviloxodontae]